MYVERGRFYLNPDFAGTAIKAGHVNIGLENLLSVESHMEGNQKILHRFFSSKEEGLEHLPYRAAYRMGKVVGYESISADDRSKPLSPPNFIDADKIISDLASIQVFIGPDGRRTEADKTSRIGEGVKNRLMNYSPEFVSKVGEILYAIDEPMEELYFISAMVSVILPFMARADREAQEKF